MGLRERLTRSYFTADPRSLALGRIALALVLLTDLLNRTSVLRDLYTNVGLLPNHTLLWRPQGRAVFSLFFMASTPFEAAVGFALCGVAYLSLLAGFRTRLAQVASVLCVISLHARTFQNGGDVVLGELALWTMFLPTGQRYSIDSLRARLRAHRETTVAELNDRGAFEPDSTQVRSLAVGAICFQLALIYLLNAIQKNGETWREGTAIHYVLHQDTVATNLAVWVRGWLQPMHSRILTRATVIAELSLPFLILFPIAQRTTRHLAIALSVSLHVGFSIFLNLEIFTPAMIAFLPNLLPAADFDALERWWRGRPAREVLFDDSAGICFQAARVLARLDRATHLVFRGRQDEPEHALVVVDPAIDRQWVGVPAVAQIARSLPLGLPVAWLLDAPGIHSLAGAACRMVSQRRRGIASFLGTAGAVPPSVDTPSVPVAPHPAASPAQQHAQIWLARLREGTAALVIALAVSQLLVDNRTIASRFPLERPGWVEQAAMYLQIVQRWSMFAPDVPRTDMNVSIDAVTVDGRHVDPFSEVANPVHHFPGQTIPAALHQNSFLVDYAVSMPWIPDYHQAFGEWIFRYPERTGRPNDKIVSFRAFVVEDDSPPPGERQPRNPRARVFYQYPE